MSSSTSIRHSFCSNNPPPPPPRILHPLRSSTFSLTTISTRSVAAFRLFTVRSSSSGHFEKSVQSVGGIDFSTQPYDTTPFPAIKAGKRVVLVRHGQSTWNAEGRIQGSSNFSVLTEKGESQAQSSRQMLIEDSFDVCFASPLTRSKRTAEIIWGSREKEIITDSDLREIDLYSFQGLLKHEGKAKFGAAYLQWQIDPANFMIDGHYPVRELWARARNCWTRILSHESKSVLVVAHNAVNQALIATAVGLGTEYFRILLQSNCGVSVLDFTPGAEGGSPNICLNRLNQTPGPPVAAVSSGGRKTSKQIILVCHGVTEKAEADIRSSGEGPMNVLGIIQSQKTAELLLDLKVNAIISSPDSASLETASAISKVQEAADYLGADYAPRSVEIKQMHDLDIESTLQPSKRTTEFDDGASKALWEQSKKVWQLLLGELSDESELDKVVVVVGHPMVHVALMVHSLGLTQEWMGSFHLDHGSTSGIDFPDGPGGRGQVRFTNYTAHLGRWSIPISEPKFG